MGTSVIPALIDALVTQSTSALPDRLVVDGYGATSDYNPNVLMVGVDDPGESSSAQSSDADQEMATTGTPRSRTQTGSVTLAALSWRGDVDQKAARDAAYATQAVVENLVRADPTLGLATPGRMTCQMGNERLTQNQYAATDDTAGGVDALLIFTVTFTARI